MAPSCVYLHCICLGAACHCGLENLAIDFFCGMHFTVIPWCGMSCQTEVWACAHQLFLVFLKSTDVIDVKNVKKRNLKNFTLRRVFAGCGPYLVLH